MNQDWRDKRIRELFHELGKEDERQTPGFSVMLEAALRRRKVPRRLLVWRIAAAVAVPLVALVLGLALLGNRSSESLPPIDPTLLTKLPFPQVNPDSMLPPPQPFVAVRPRHRKSASRTYRQSILISQWHSPTDFLLKTPGSEFLRNLPRMPDSPPGIPGSLPDKHN